VQQLHRDFKKVINAYLKDWAPAPSRRDTERVFVFIDDLDRCEVPRAADLIQGLNLLISDSPQIVFILGIDRQKIAAALAVKYQQFLPYFPVSRRSRRDIQKIKPDNGQADPPLPKAEPASAKTSEFDPTPGLEFGYSFLEKFIQLAFQVPRITEYELQGFLESLETKSTGAGTSEQDPRTYPAEVAEHTKEAGAGTPEQDSRTTPSEVAKDTPEVLQIARVVASSLDFNPRRLKQFLNVFRLQRFIAFHTGKGATMQQLGKFVAVLLRFPAILPDLLIYPTLLAELEKAALSPAGTEHSPAWVDDFDGMNQSRFEHWRDRPALRRLLRAGPDAKNRPEAQADQNNSSRWSLAEFDVTAFINVSPLLVPIARLPGIKAKQKQGNPGQSAKHRDS
jgi:hypothetical protein